METVVDRGEERKIKKKKKDKGKVKLSFGDDEEGDGDDAPTPKKKMRTEITDDDEGKEHFSSNHVDELEADSRSFNQQLRNEAK